MPNKKEFRAQYKAVRHDIAPQERLLADKTIFSHIVTGDLYQKATAMMCFVSFGTEVETKSLICQAIEDGKKVAVPYCYPQSDEMCACEIHSLSDLVEGKHGILAPKWPEHTLDVWKLSLVFVPGLAFDRQGYRLGYGRGYYDRFLQNKPENVITIGLGYFCQLCEQVPHETHDQRLDYFVSERGFLRF